MSTSIKSFRIQGYLWKIFTPVSIAPLIMSKPRSAAPQVVGQRLQAFLQLQQGKSVGSIWRTTIMISNNMNDVFSPQVCYAFACCGYLKSICYICLPSRDRFSLPTTRFPALQNIRKWHDGSGKGCAASYLLSIHRPSCCGR